MKRYAVLLVLSLCAGAAFAQETPLVAAANQLQADMQKALPASSFSADEKAKLTADAAQLVTNANARAKGASPDRRAGRSAGEEIEKFSKSGKLQAADATLLQNDLKAVKAAAK